MKLVADLVLTWLLLVGALFALVKFPTTILWAGFSALLILRLVACYVKLVGANRSRRAA